MRESSDLETTYVKHGGHSVPKVMKHELYEKKISGTPGLDNVFLFPTQVSMKEDEFLVCAKVAGQAPRCFGRLNANEEPADVITVQDNERSPRPFEVSGAEAKNYAKFEALQRDYQEHFLER